MKKILLTLAAATATIGSAQAVTLYSDTWTAIDKSSSAAQVIGGASPTLTFGEVFGPTNGTSVTGSVVTLTSNQHGRSVGIWLDSSAWDAGDVTVSFDISGFATNADTTGTNSQFRLYSAATLDGSTSAGLDMQTGASPNISGQTTFVGSENITGNGTFTYTFDNAAGTDGIALVFKNDLFNEYTIGAITVTAVPEPTSTALLGLGALAFISRRKRA